jgi:hypothetical protein
MHRLVKQLRFSLANALRATAWLCVSAGSYAFLASHYHYDPLTSRHWPEWIPDPILVFLFHLVVWSPFVAVGALFGRTRQGMIAGGVGLLLLWAIMFIWMPKVVTYRGSLRPTQLAAAPYSHVK